VPLELYCYTSTSVWVEYENIQGSIFDHLIGVLPEFGLRLYQRPSGSDVLSGLRPLAQGNLAQGNLAQGNLAQGNLAQGMGPREASN
jgi:miniconductance mechanosensitive channel